MASPELVDLVQRFEHLGLRNIVRRA